MGNEVRKILLIDDDPLILLALSRAYRSRLLDIHTAANATDALQCINEQIFELFILDLDLQGRNGFELLEEIDRRFPYVPIILTTAADVNNPDLTGELSSLRKKGIWHLLEKPFHLELLNKLIEKFLDYRQEKLIGSLNHSHEHGHDKRNHTRRTRIMPVQLSFEQEQEGELVRKTIKAILTDTSDGGVGLLSTIPMERAQLIRFDESLQGKCGIVAWSAPLEGETCRAGVHFCYGLS